MARRRAASYDRCSNNNDDAGPTMMPAQRPFRKPQPKAGRSRHNNDDNNNERMQQSTELFSAFDESSTIIYPLLLPAFLKKASSALSSSHFRFPPH